MGIYRFIHTSFLLLTYYMGCRTEEVGGNVVAA